MSSVSSGFHFVMNLIRSVSVAALIKAILN
jgi:hypothetical protein